jgi:O-antigen/teichoic acid export membrane protein
MVTGERRFIQDVVLSLASLATSQLVHFILRIFLARYFDKEELGVYTLAYTFFSFGVLLSAFGIGGGLSKYVAENKDDGLALPTMRKGRLLLVALVSSVAIGCAMWLALHFSSHWVANSFFEMPELSTLLQIVAFSFPFVALQKATLGFLNGMRRMGLYAFINVSQNVLTLILTVVLAVLGYGLEGAVVAMVAPIVLFSLYSLFALRGYVSRPLQGQSARIFRILLTFGVFVVMGNSMYMLFYNIDRILLGRLITDIADAETAKGMVGIYGIAATLASLVPLIPSAIQLVTGPTIANYWGRGEMGSIQTLINRTMKYSAMLIVPISLAAIFLSRDLITLVFGEEYVSGTFTLQILLAGFIFGGTFTSVGTALSMTRWVHMGFIIGSVQVVMNVALCMVLIPRYEMSGAATATMIAAALGTLLNAYFVQRFIKVSIDWRWFARFGLVCALVFAASLALSLVVNEYLCLVVGVAVLVFIIARFFISAEDREVIKGLLSLRKAPWLSFRR